VIDEAVVTRESIDKQPDELTRNYFEPRLTALGLGMEQLQTQSAEELAQSLDRINDAITNPDSFGVVRGRITPRVGLVVALPSEAQFEIGILPLLLERKKFIVERLAQVRKKQKIDNLRSLIDSVPDTGLQAKLRAEIADLESSSRKLQEQAEEIEAARRNLKASTDIEIARLKAEVFERRSKVWRSFLERESVATLVGALLLLVIGAAVLVSMFLGTKTPDLISNTFLLVLGYFFGQSTSKAPAKSE